MHSPTAICIFLGLVSSVVAHPAWSGGHVSNVHFEVLAIRASTTVNPAAVTSTVCTDPDTDIVFHDQNVAELAICGGIAGTIEFCGGNPTTTTGSSGTALFTLEAATDGATINISKGRWEGCVRAARAVCPTGDFTSICIGGATTGNVNFSLEAQ